MKKIFYNKLIRDRIPLKIKKSGGDYKIRTMRMREYELEFLQKVSEEASGLLSAKDRAGLISELADIYAVLDEIKKLKKISKRELSQAMKQNFKKKGGFKKRLYLVWSSDTGYRTNERRGKKH